MIIIAGIGGILFLILSAVIYPKFGVPPLEIYQYVLRDRIIVTDRVLMRKNLFVGYRLKNKIEIQGGIKTIGKLLVDGSVISEITSLNTFDEFFRSGNLVFPLPHKIEDGFYTIQIRLLNLKEELLAEGAAKIDRKNLKAFFPGQGQGEAKPREELLYRDCSGKVQNEKSGENMNYCILASSPLEYVFPGSRQKGADENYQISIKTVKNKFEPVTFSLCAYRDLGETKIIVGDLIGERGVVSKENIQVGLVESVEETYSLPDGKYLRVPTLIRPGNQFAIKKGEIQRIWITIRIDENANAGKYSGTLSIEPEKGERKAIPINLTVFPILLEDIPQKDYFMLMTYEFTELTNPWSEEEKKKIYEAGWKILKNYKEHGMTTLCFHSPFVLMTREDGKPNLDDIFAGLKAAKENGFERPIIWYLGHLIQTAKPRHPGNIIGFDKEIHLRRLDYLIGEVNKFARENGAREVIFSPIDEAGDSSQDYQSQRKEITPLLLQVIARNQGKSLLTGKDIGGLGSVDYFCSIENSPSVRKSVQQGGKKFWLYNNQVTIACRNPAYARYIYGYYVWKQGLDGMGSWTFQNTQNASGDPAIADGPGMDIYLAYPDPNGPLNTIKWEAIREGIDDHKLIYQLEKRIKRLQEKGISASKYKNFLREIRENNGEPPCQLEWAEEWNLSYFEKTKQQIIFLILEADQKIKFAAEKEASSRNGAMEMQDPSLGAEAGVELPEQGGRGAGMAASE